VKAFFGRQGFCVRERSTPPGDEIAAAVTRSHPGRPMHLTPLPPNRVADVCFASFWPRANSEYQSTSVKPTRIVQTNASCPVQQVGRKTNYAGANAISKTHQLSIVLGGIDFETRSTALADIAKEAKMSNYDQSTAASTGARTDITLIDAGLRAYMLRIYNHMAAGIGLTALVAWLTYLFTSPELLQSPLMWVFILTPLALVFFISARINTLSVSAARSLFFVYAALVGVSLSILFHIYTQSSITRVFFITAATFGALSLFGYTTRRDLSGFGTFLFMGLIGIIIASLINLFLRSTQLDWLVSIIGVGVFAGLTAYDTQRLKTMYDSNDDAISAGRKAVIGALSLYLDFINLFMMLLRLAGNRR